MICLFTCASRGWRSHQATVLGAVGETLRNRAADGPTVKLDDACLANIKFRGEAPLHRIVEMKELVREVSDAYEPDAHAIAQMLDHLPADCTLVIDGSAFPYDCVSKLLAHLRTTMFTRADWPAALLLIVGEQAIEGATIELASSFYLLPNRRSSIEASVYAYRVYRAARIARIFLWSQAATARAFRFSDRIERFKRLSLKRDEADFV